MIQVSITGTEQVRARLAKLGSAMTTQALAETAVEVEQYVEQQAAKHSKKGALVRSVYKTKLQDGSWEIGHDLQHAPHALFVHWGTKPHVIQPKASGTYASYKDIAGKTVRKGVPKGGAGRMFLRWASGGRFHFAKKVHHPGNKPDKWMERAAALAPKIFEQHVNRLIEQQA